MNIINHHTGSYDIETANRYASELNKHDAEGWKYVVVPSKNGKMGRIDVYDADGILVVEGFMI